MNQDPVAAGPVYKPRMLMNQHFSSNDGVTAVGPFTLIQMCWSNVFYGGAASPLLGPFPMSTPCRLVRWASTIIYFGGGGGGTWRWDFYLNGVLATSSAAFAIPLFGLPNVNSGRPLAEIDITPADHWGPELAQNPVLTGIGVVIARLDVTLEVL